MKRIFLGLLVALFYALHQDVWLWRKAEPFLFGFLPVGLAYHVFYTLAAALLMALLVRWAWPSNLEPEDGPRPRASREVSAETVREGGN
jgi:hypothetical protein